MLRALIFTTHDARWGALREIARAARWELARQSWWPALDGALREARWDVLALDADALAERLDALRALCEAHPQLPVVVLGQGAASAQMLAALEAGVEVWLSWPEPSEPEAMGAMLQLIAHHAQRARLARQGAQRLARSEVELAAINELARQLAHTLDQDAMVAQALRCVTQTCRKGAAAYLSWGVETPPEDEPSPGIGLFTESEAEDLEQTLAISREIELSPARTLTLVSQRSADRLLVCLPPLMHPSWEEFLSRQRPLLLYQRPALGMFPGLEPLWHRLREGVVALVPIWGRVEPLGILILAEMSLSARGEHLSEEGLEAIAGQLGGALENARLFADSRAAYESLQAAQDHLVHAEKFAAVGHLAAQIAHEINNPSSFVISNMSVMTDYVEVLGRCVDEARAITAQISPDAEAQLDALLERHEIGFMREDLEVLLRRSLAGMQRIHQIVQELRYFAHDAGPELGWFDVDGLLEASLSLVRHEIKHRATVTCDFAGGCQVFSDANKLSQVFLNLLVNASQALEHGDPERDVLRVGTTHYQDYVLVFVEDTGVGMSREVLARLFEPFFTTRARGQGTGLGLAISRDILRSLGGDVRVFSEPERGSRFELVLPVRAPHLARQDASLRESGSYQTPPRAWAAAPGPSDDEGAGEGH